jgi:hypothetical protein
MRLVPACFILLLYCSTGAWAQYKPKAPVAREEPFAAMLADGVQRVAATDNKDTLFWLTNADTFLYDPDSENFTLPDGREGGLLRDQVKRIYGRWFRFNFSRYDFQINNSKELYQQAKAIGIDLATLVEQAKHTRDGLLMYFSLYEIVDGASATDFLYDVWAIIHSWNDSSLAQVINSMHEPNRKTVCRLLAEDNRFGSCPVAYYKFYYPQTLEVIRRNVQPANKRK